MPQSCVWELVGLGCWFWFQLVLGTLYPSLVLGSMGLGGSAAICSGVNMPEFPFLGGSCWAVRELVPWESCFYRVWCLVCWFEGCLWGGGQECCSTLYVGRFLTLYVNIFARWFTDSNILFTDLFSLLCLSIEKEALCVLWRDLKKDGGLNVLQRSASFDKDKNLKQMTYWENITIMIVRQ